MANEKRLIWDEDAKRHLIALAVGHHTETLHIDMILNAILHHTPAVDAVIFPCKVGDMVYRKDGAWNVVGFECDRSGSWRVKLERWKDQFWDYHERTKVVFKSFGKTVFLTSEEAEAALAKMDGERSKGE